MLRGWRQCILLRHPLLPRRLPRVSRSGVLASYWLHWCCSLGCELPGRACSGVELVARSPAEGARGHHLPLVSHPCQLPVEGLLSWCGFAAAALPGSVLLSVHHKFVLPEWLFVVASFLVVHGRFGTAEVHMGAPGPLRVPDTGFLISHVNQGRASE